MGRGLRVPYITQSHVDGARQVRVGIFAAGTDHAPAYTGVDLVDEVVAGLRMIHRSLANVAENAISVSCLILGPHGQLTLSQKKLRMIL